MTRRLQVEPQDTHMRLHAVTGTLRLERDTAAEQRRWSIAAAVSC